jgi:hypothetical protein
MWVIPIDLWNWLGVKKEDGQKRFLGFPEGSLGNEPFGSRSEPGACLIAPSLLLPPGEVPEGRARGVQDTATRVQSDSEG